MESTVSTPSSSRVETELTVPASWLAQPGLHRVSTRHVAGMLRRSSPQIQGTVCFLFLLALRQLRAWRPGAARAQSATRHGKPRHGTPTSDIDNRPRRGCASMRRLRSRECRFHTLELEKAWLRTRPPRIKLTRFRGVESPRGGPVWSGQMGRRHRGSMSMSLRGKLPRKTSQR